MRYQVVFTPEALRQLEALYAYVSQAASHSHAQTYTEAILAYCETLQTFPLRGTRRDDVRPGLRITNYKGRAVIAFEVSPSEVAILGIFYGGQDFEAALIPPDSDLKLEP